MTVLTTDRLDMRPIHPDDAAFYLELINTEGWLANIGDKGIRTVEAARESILTGPVAMYEQHGFGLCTVRLRSDGTPIGLCGLIRRDSLPHVDIGYGYLPSSWGHGYAMEAARATLAQARTLGLPHLLGICAPFNTGSRRILENLGMRLQETRRLLETDTRDTCIYGMAL